MVTKLAGGALIVGSSGAIGNALKQALPMHAINAALNLKAVFCTARSQSVADQVQSIKTRLSFTAVDMDIESDESIRQVRAQVQRQLADTQISLRLIIIATGILHDTNLSPEKSMRQIDSENFARVLRINTIGPSLVIREFAPLLEKTHRSALAVLSARVGSISDNRLGGWYAYRSSKAALNMVVRSAAIELARTHPQTVCVALHPGTVNSPLSKPFQRSVSDDKLFDPAYSAGRLLDVLHSLKPEDSGHIYAWDGAPIQP